MSIEWISSEYSLLVDEQDIGSWVYVGDTPKKGSTRERHFNSCIDVSLPIGQKKYKSSKADTGQFLLYNKLTPDERATYLHWLASPRESSNCRSGFVRLYVSGLEYRFFMDDSDLEEKREIYEEVKRLSHYYGDNIYLRWSFDSFLKAAKSMIYPLNYTPKFRGYNADRSRSAAIAIGRDIALGEKVTAERSLAWWRWDNSSWLDRTYYACEEEFKLLYKYLFDEKYPNGFVVKKSKQNLVALYSAQFGKFDARIKLEANGIPIPDIRALKEPVEIFQSIVDETIEALKKLGRLRYRGYKVYNILDENSRIPAKIRHKFTPEGISDVKRWLKGKGPNSFFTIKRLYDQLYFKGPKAISLANYKTICDNLAKLGYSLTPDPRLINRPPNLNEKLLVFPILPSEDHSIGVSYDLLACILALGTGANIAKTFGKMTSAKTKALEQIIKRQEKNKLAERTVLISHLNWYLKNPLEKDVLKRFLKKSDEGQKRIVRQAVIDIARATGATNTKVVSHVEEVYKLLGLDSIAVYSDLHAGEIVEQPKSGIQTENGNASKDNDAGSRTTRPVRLDKKKIKTLSKETEKSREVLSRVFSAGPIE